jgi:trimeric autotransporter adhesin
MALQIRRGPTADRVTKTFVEGEIIYDTDLKEVFIGDGTSLGGKEVSTYTDSQSKDAAALTLTHNVGHSNIAFAYDNVSKRVTATVTLDGTYNDLVQDTTPELGGNLLLNGKDIALSSGPVIINGTTGNLTGNLTGNVTGNVSGNADTVTNGVYTTSTLNIGQTSVPLNRASSVQTLTGVSITGNAATVTNGIYNTGNQAITGELSATAFRGNVYGSVYKADGIALLVNAPTDSINAASVTTVDLTVSGTLVVNGTTTTINSTTLEIADKNITLAKGAATALAADGAGISIDGANATILYVQSTDRIVINKAISSSNGFVGNVTGNLTGNADTVTNGVYTSGDQTIAGTKTFSSPILGDLQGNIATDSLSASTTTIDVSSPMLSTQSITAPNIIATTAITTSSILTVGAGLEIQSSTVTVNEILARAVAASDSLTSPTVAAVGATAGLFVGTLVNEIFTMSVALTQTSARIDAPLTIARLDSNAIQALVDPLNGTMVYNTTVNKFQGRQNGVWINLDGTT